MNHFLQPRLSDTGHLVNAKLSHAAPSPGQDPDDVDIQEDSPNDPSPQSPHPELL